ncbi:MAG: nucleoside triphosphate pyrophosphohydrolase [Deltaproteobacteria bacterium]|nr:nucleoside triphosphate pyrophosphohydrolase [Deltaproteobacteria bacterium]
MQLPENKSKKQLLSKNADPRLKRSRASITRLTGLMASLRAPDGCPWDREQTLESLAPFIIEEAYEVVSAIDSGSMDEIKDELGDLLFQIIFASQIAEEKKCFTLASVIDGTARKMTRRHPHVFGDREAEKAKTPKDVLKRWDQIKNAEKMEEKQSKGSSPLRRSSPSRVGYLSGVPEAMPALLRAHKISKKAAKTGFDWKNAAQVFEKVDEEMAEFKQALKKKNRRNMEEEMGDLLFTIVNVSRFMEINPEEALRKTIGKFITRFHYIESKAAAKGRELSALTLGEMDALWEEAKKTKRKKSIKTDH